MAPPYFELLRQMWTGTPSRTGFVACDCPFCGAQRDQSKKRAAFRDEHNGLPPCFCCKKCGQNCGLRKLCEEFMIDVGASIPVSGPRMPATPRKPAHWLSNTGYYLERYCEALDRVNVWQAYKPLSLESISRYRLGVGAMPAPSSCLYPRLIVPVFWRGTCVGFRGRAFRAGDDSSKWLTAAGMTPYLYNADLITPGCDLIICENQIDAVLAMQETPGIVAVCSTHGAGTWLPEWTALIAAISPRRVIVWLDNDLAGQPNQETEQALVAVWRIKMQAKVKAGEIRAMPQAHPHANGPRIVQDLRRAGVKSLLYQWPVGTPAKHDLGAALMSKIALDIS